MIERALLARVDGRARGLGPAPESLADVNVGSCAPRDVVHGWGEIGTQRRLGLSRGSIRPCFCQPT
jgi:hypothetical protein